MQNVLTQQQQVSETPSVHGAFHGSKALHPAGLKHTNV
jgi:hypothetical protein